MWALLFLTEVAIHCHVTVRAHAAVASSTLATPSGVQGNARGTSVFDGVVGGIECINGHSKRKRKGYMTPPTRKAGSVRTAPRAPCGDVVDAG